MDNFHNNFLALSAAGVVFLGSILTPKNSSVSSCACDICKKSGSLFKNKYWDSNKVIQLQKTGKFPKNEFEINNFKKKCMNSKLTILSGLVMIISLLLILFKRKEEEETAFSKLGLQIGCSFKDIEIAFRDKMLDIYAQKFKPEEKDRKIVELTNNYNSVKKELKEGIKPEKDQPKELILAIPNYKILVFLYFFLIFYFCSFLNKIFKNRTKKRKGGIKNKTLESLFKILKTSDEKFEINFVEIIATALKEQIEAPTCFENSDEIKNLNETTIRNFKQKFGIHFLMKSSENLQIDFISLIILSNLIGSEDLALIISNSKFSEKEKKELICYCGNILESAELLFPCLLLVLLKGKSVEKFIEFTHRFYNSDLIQVLKANKFESQVKENKKFENKNIPKDLNLKTTKLLPPINCLIESKVKKNTKAPYIFNANFDGNTMNYQLSSAEPLIIKDSAENFISPSKKILKKEFVHNPLSPAKGFQKKIVLIFYEKYGDSVEVRIMDEFLGVSDESIRIDPKKVRIVSLSDDWQIETKF